MKNSPPLSKLSDEELQARIDRFSRAMLEAQERFAASRTIEDRAARDGAWVAMKACLQERGRRRRIVERMEQGRGLA
jgi:hypothetical protein